MIWRQLVSSVLFQVKGWVVIRSDDRSDNKRRDTGRGSETPSLDGVFRDPPWFALFCAMSTGNYPNKLPGALSNLRQVRGEVEAKSRRINELMCPWACVCLCAGWSNDGVSHGWASKNQLLKISAAECRHQNERILPMIVFEKNSQKYSQLHFRVVFSPNCKLKMFVSQLLGRPLKMFCQCRFTVFTSSAVRQPFMWHKNTDITFNLDYKSSAGSDAPSAGKMVVNEHKSRHPNPDTPH